jgi:hypothetical protein
MPGFQHLGGPTILCYPEMMAMSIRVNRKKRGRPKTTGRGTLVGVRLHRADLTNLDQWINRQTEKPTRPEAIRNLLRLALTQTLPASEAQKASEFADHTAERLVDKSIPAEEQQRRKRALIKGPKEFREIREDLPKLKA